MDIIIPGRFNGPTASANGGYAAGSIAALVDGPAAVRLTSAPPLDTAMRVVEEHGGFYAYRGDDVVLSAAPAILDLEVPAPVPNDAAILATEDYPGWTYHGAPTCFVCGPARAAPDGLRIFPGPVRGRDLVAAPWTPHASLGDAAGTVDARIVWAVLDCPGAWAATAADPEGMPYFPALGTMTGAIDEPVTVGEPLIVLAWHLGTDGRKLHTAAAIMTEDGRLKARARHIEIKLSPDWAG